MTKITASPTGMIILLFHRFYRIVSPMGYGLIMIHAVDVTL